MAPVFWLTCSILPVPSQTPHFRSPVMGQGYSGIVFDWRADRQDYLALARKGREGRKPDERFEALVGRPDEELTPRATPALDAACFQPGRMISASVLPSAAASTRRQATSASPLDENSEMSRSRSSSRYVP